MKTEVVISESAKEKTSTKNLLKLAKAIINDKIKSYTFEVEVEETETVLKLS